MSEYVKKIWRGQSTPWALLGAGTFFAFGMNGCSSGELHRNVYASQADCSQDYPSNLCEQALSPDPPGTYLGPKFRTVNGRPSACRSSDPGPGRSGSAIGMSARAKEVRLIQRGGFGASCSRRRTGS